MHIIGALDLEKYKCVTTDIITKDVVLGKGKPKYELKK